MVNIFFDFDGTLIDCRTRIYRLFSALLLPDKVEETKYWEARLSGMRQKDILKEFFQYSDERCVQFNEKWLSLIEADEWLGFDTPREGASNLLRSLSNEYTLYIVTNRQSRKSLITQLSKFGWKEYFKEFLVTEQKCTKLKLLSERLDTSGENFFIGDTCDDIDTAKALGMKSFAVRSGLEPWPNVLACGPFNSVEDLYNLFQRIEDTIKKA